MRTERTILCGENAETSEPDAVASNAPPLRLRLWGPDHEITLKIEHIGERLARNIPSRFVDLAEIATYVYVADQAVTRGGTGVDHLGENWRRTFRFQIPVREPDFWGSQPVTEALRQTLGFLSEDDYHFDFRPLANPTPVQHYLDFAGQESSAELEEVVMFSGGLDSVAGAVQEAVTDRRRVALVTHRSTEKFRIRHDKLCALLNAHAAPMRPLYYPVSINKKKGLGREYTQRSRSFLYAALGATIAQLHGLPRLRFYENGVVSLNLPLSPQVVGAKATRTTHPRVIEGFERVLSLVAGRQFSVENRFVWKTKTDVIRQIGDAGCADLIGQSTSCTHTWETDNTHPHCGTCSQCIDRRFAVLGAGLEEHDPASAYEVDLLTHPRREGEHRTMLAAYVETASAISRMSADNFFARYGEIGRVVRHLNGTADAVAMKVYELYRRHAASVSRVIDEGIARHSTQIRNRELPDSCLLRLVYDTASTNAEPVLPQVVARPSPAVGTVALRTDKAENVFRRLGRAWLVRFAGKDEFIVLPSRGASYLHELLSAPRREFSVFKLAFQVAKAPAQIRLGDAGERSDPEAQRAYRAQYQELMAELDAARAENDEASVERLRRDVDLLADQLKDRGWAGRPKREGDDRERVRKAFQLAIRRVIRQIAQSDQAMADHLSASIRAGVSPVYQPPDKVIWET